MNSKPAVIFGGLIILVAIIAAISYAWSGRFPSSVGQEARSTIKDISVATDATTTSADFYSQGGLNTATSSGQVPVVPLPDAVSAAIDTSAWQMYVDNKSGFSLEYPSTLTQITNPDGSFALAFSKSAFFHWPLLDDARLSVSATPETCPPLSLGGADGQPASKQTVSMNGLSFTRQVGTDVGAGQLYTQVVYDTINNGYCYRLSFLDHGTNGAGFYVDDLSLAQKYDAVHATDMQTVYETLNAVVGTFRVLARAS